ncbi:diacylglycerol kinase family lipid kinase [bacterium]|nr:diacylglycerol kinase family lipid kinase [bacterium]
MRAIVIANPESGKPLIGRKKWRFCSIIEKEIFNAWTLFTDPEGERSPESLASFAQKEGFHLIIVRGGDGTASRVVNGLDFSKKVPVLAIIPAGTGNDFAYALGLRYSLSQNIEVIKQRKVISVDLGVVRFSNQERRFVNTVSVGIDAEINNMAHRLAPQLRKVGMFRFAYVIAALERMLHRLNFPEVVIEIDGKKKVRGPISLAAITNSYRYGGGFKINLSARFDDGILNLCIAQPIRRILIPYFILKMKQGTHSTSSVFSFYSFQKLIIRSETALPFQIDGERYPSQNCIEVSVLPKALKVLVP